MTLRSPSIKKALVGPTSTEVWGSELDAGNQSRQCIEHRSTNALVLQLAVTPPKPLDVAFGLHAASPT